MGIPVGTQWTLHPNLKYYHDYKWLSIIATDGTSDMADITWAQKNLFGVVGKSRRWW